MLKRIIHIGVLTVYLVTSCLVIGVNKWSSGKDQENEDFSDWLISAMTIPVSEDPGDDTEIPFLFKDPSEDGTVVVPYFPGFTAFEFSSIEYTFHVEKKVKDPLLNIFSPPPQLS